MGLKAMLYRGSCDKKIIKALELFVYIPTEQPCLQNKQAIPPLIREKFQELKFEATIKKEVLCVDEEQL
jgi:hypothetical protein